MLYYGDFFKYDYINRKKTLSCFSLIELKLTEECNQLRKNLTLMTIESESKKAEITTLNSQISILESTVKSLREGSEKYSQMESNYDTTVSELRKKQDDLKKLQQV